MKAQEIVDWHIQYAKERQAYLYKRSYNFLKVKITPLPSNQYACGVYIVRDDKGIVLYVGYSNTIRERLKYHKQKSWWWDKTNTIEIREYALPSEALLKEQILIKQLSPLYNKMHSQSYKQYKKNAKHN